MEATYKSFNQTGKKINRSRAKVWGDVFMFTLTAKSEELRI